MMQLRKTKTEENIEQPSVALPEDRSQALKVMIRFSEKLLDISEQETQALVQDDMRKFSMLQDQKTALSREHTKASSEFRRRIMDFRAADPGLLDRLEKLQQELGDKIRSNNEIVTRVFTQHRKNSQESLIAAQELGQQPYNTQHRGA